ncbi:MAG TPA: DUF4915 domain-containing protein [Thermoanaerobaculia bacterium]
MRRVRRKARAGIWARPDAEWRHPAQATNLWRDAGARDPRLLSGEAQGAWWEILARTKVTLLVTREYEHLLIAFSARRGRPRVTYWPLPHPSGLAVDRGRRSFRVASTRNPNQIFRFEAVADPADRSRRRALLPVSSRVFPGSLYLHDLAIIGGKLYGNAVGQNAVVSLDERSGYRRVWWPRSIDSRFGPIVERNHLQLNSIAAGATLAASYFSASTDTPSSRRPGHRNFAVDGRGVIFSGRTREPIAGGLTRPHSARLHRGRLWVDNSGYGELGTVGRGRFEPVARLPGWTRGLCFLEDLAFVGTSRIIPEFRQYAPGLDPRRSICGVHAVDTRSGRILGSFLWPRGNQIFAVEWLEGALDLPLLARGARGVNPNQLFYSFSTERRK